MVPFKVSVTSCICTGAKLGSEAVGPAGCKGRLDMWRVGLAIVALLTTVGAAHAQFWGSPYGRGGYYQRPQPGLFSPFFDWD